MGEKKIRLYDISSEQRNIYIELGDNGGVLTPELETRLVACEGSLPTKMYGCSEYRKSLQNDIKLGKDRRDGINGYIKKKERELADFDKYLLLCMETAGEKTVEYTGGKITVKEPNYKQGSLVIADGANIPSKYLDIVPEKTTPRKDDIKKAINNKEEVEGCYIEPTKKSIIMTGG